MKLSVGTYKGHCFSIQITGTDFKTLPFRADVVIADELTGEVTGSFIEHGTEDWQLRNACTKRIMTQEVGS